MAAENEEKAWYKVVRPEYGWDRLSLKGIRYVADFKRAIKEQLGVLATHVPTPVFVIKATKRDEDVRNAVQLNSTNDLASVLRKFDIENPPSIKQSFDDNIRLFVDFPSSFDTPFNTNIPSIGLLSETQFLKLIPPFLNYIHKSSRGGTAHSPISRAPTPAILWDDFIANASNTPKENIPKYPHPVFEEFRNISGEFDVQEALRQNVLRPFYTLLGREGDFTRHRVKKDIQGEPDFILQVSGTLRLVVEVKTKWVLPDNVGDLATLYNQEFQAQNQGSGTSTLSVFHQLRQIFGYLASNNIQYGVLSTYNKTWFLARCPNKPTELQISPAIGINDQQPTLFQCLYYLICQTRNSHQFQPLPPTPPIGPPNKDDTDEDNNEDDDDSYSEGDNDNGYNEGDNDDNGNTPDSEGRDPDPGNHSEKQEPLRRNPPRGARARAPAVGGRDKAMDRLSHPSYLLDGEKGLEFFDWGSYEILDVLGSGRSGTVFRAILRGEMVALKLCDLWQHPDYEQELVHEVQVYQALRNLQGVCIPQFKGAGYTAAGFFIIATEIAGRPLESGETLSNKDRQAIQNALLTIHQQGYIHNDICEDNILISRSGHQFNAFFIDFTFSKRGCSGDFQKEMRALMGLF